MAPAAGAEAPRAILHEAHGPSGGPHAPVLKAARAAAQQRDGSKGARSRDPCARPAVPHLGALQDAFAGKTRGARVGLGHRPRTGRATTRTEPLLEQRPSKGAAADTDQEGSVSEWGLETTRSHPDQHRKQVGLKEPGSGLHTEGRTGPHPGGRAGRCPRPPGVCSRSTPLTPAPKGVTADSRAR